MQGKAHPSPFAALSFPNSKKVPIYCWVGRESFPVVAGQSPASYSRFTATICTIIVLIKKLAAILSDILPLLSNRALKASFVTIYKGKQIFSIVISSYCPTPCVVTCLMYVSSGLICICRFEFYF